VRAVRAASRRTQHRRRALPSSRSVPALYGALTAGLVALVLVVASVVSPATPPSIAELSPSARDRIEEARDDLAAGFGGDSGRCDPGDVGCAASGVRDARDGPGSGSAAPPPIEVAAGRRCYGNPPRQTEDPHSPPCVFEIFKGDNRGATAPGVTATEIRVAVPIPSVDSMDREIVEALIAHFNRRYEFYGRRLNPVFVEANPYDDAAANQAAAQDLIATKPFGVVSSLRQVTNAAIYRRLAEARVVSVVSKAAGFDSEAVGGFTWLVDPPLDVRLGAGAALVCRALNGRNAIHAGPEFARSERRFAVLVRTEESVRPHSASLVNGLRDCGADFEVFDASLHMSEEQRAALMVQLKQGAFTTVLPVTCCFNTDLYQSASRAGYFPEWVDLGVWGVHLEQSWGGSTRVFTEGHGSHAFGFTPEVRVRPDAEVPAMWALREGGQSISAPQYTFENWYNALLVLASGIQGAGPNLTPETFARALRSTRFPNPNSGAPPYWQQDIGFALGDSVFHDDYAIWWWSEDAPSQTSDSSSGRGSFCYLDRGGRFSANSFPANADPRLFSASEPCR